MGKRRFEVRKGRLVGVRWPRREAAVYKGVVGFSGGVRRGVVGTEEGVRERFRGRCNCQVGRRKGSVCE